MNCFKCGADYEPADLFCRKCGTTLPSRIAPNSSSSGDQSFNGGQHNIYTGNNISVGRSQPAEPIAFIDRHSTTQLKVAGHPIKVAWLIISSVLGILGSIASLWGIWTTSYQTISILIIGVCATGLLIGLALNKTRFVRLPLFTNLESNQVGEIFTTKIGGACPKCDGQLKLRDVGQRGHQITVVRCTRNPDHVWGFDPTVLDDL